MSNSQDPGIRVALGPVHFGILATASGCTCPRDEDHGSNVVDCIGASRVQPQLQGGGRGLDPSCGLDKSCESTEASEESPAAAAAAEWRERCGILGHRVLGK